MQTIRVAVMCVAAVAASPAMAVKVDAWPLPPTASAAQPDLSSAPGGALLLSWIEPQGDGHRLRVARHDGDDPATGWSTTRTVASGDDWFVNWADFPARSEEHTSELQSQSNL